MSQAAEGSSSGSQEKPFTKERVSKSIAVSFMSLEEIMLIVGEKVNRLPYEKSLMRNIIQVEDPPDPLLEKVFIRLVKIYNTHNCINLEKVSVSSQAIDSVLNDVVSYLQEEYPKKELEIQLDPCINYFDQNGRKYSGKTDYAIAYSDSEQSLGKKTRFLAVDCKSFYVFLDGMTRACVYLKGLEQEDPDRMVKTLWNIKQFDIYLI